MVRISWDTANETGYNEFWEGRLRLGSEASFDEMHFGNPTPALSLPCPPGGLATASGLLPPGVVLNVNDPTVGLKDAKGVALTVQGQASSPSIVFVTIGVGIYIPAVGPGEGSGEDVNRSVPGRSQRDTSR